jgi:hypothetical protein
MALSDFFIGKPGPGSISEAMAMHLPVIIERNIWTLPQERYNADWVIEKKVGFVLPNFREIEAPPSVSWNPPRSPNTALTPPRSTTARSSRFPISLTA